MMKHNVLKEKIGKILEIRYKPDRKPLKDDLKGWISTQSYDVLLPMIEELNMEELGITIYCGASGKANHRAMERIQEYRDKIKEIAGDQSTDKTTASSENSVYDETKGFEQIVPDVLVAMIHNSSDEVLDTVGLALCREVDRREALSTRGTGPE